MDLLKKISTKIQIFLEMIKFEHSVFALPFAYIGLLLAEGGLPRGRVFFWVTVAMISFRTMAMSANRIIDRRIDGLNVRTKNRALPVGLLKVSFVWGMAGFAAVVFEVSAFQLNLLCFKLSWIPLTLAWFYPWTKRFTWCSHFVLGMILGIAPYGSWLASREAFSWIPLFMSLGVGAWVAGFDVIYSLQDLDFDRSHGLYSFPSRFSPSLGLIITRCLHVTAVVAWFLSGWLYGLSVVYWSGLFLVVCLLIRENWMMRSLDLSRVQESFFTLNAVVSVLLFAAVLIDLLLKGRFS